jgi:hypothetical protein
MGKYGIHRRVAEGAERRQRFDEDYTDGHG